MKTEKIKQTTTDNKTYKICHVISNLYCEYCPPNKGCNDTRDNNRNWKEYRKTQYKSKYI